MQTIKSILHFSIIILTILTFGFGRPALSQTPEFNCADEDRPLYLSSPPMTGYDIRELQLRLKELGYRPGNTKGIFDAKTAEAVSQFQSEHQLKGDGRVGPLTWQALARGAESKVISEPLPPPEGELEIVIDLNKRQLTVFADGKPYQQFPIATGTADTPSPVGEWQVQSKGLHWGGGFGTRWLGLNVPWGIYGIHGTNKPYSIGSSASHGCFRMHNRHVEQLYPWIKIGTPVKVIGPEHPFGARKIKKGSTGSDIVTIQQKLKEKGFYIFGANDGRYGAWSVIAARYFQSFNFQNVSGELAGEEFQKLNTKD